MSKSNRTRPLYTRGDYKLVRRPDRPALEIVWYDANRGRLRSASARTEDVEEGKAALDRLYLERTKGEAFCPTCGQRRGQGEVYVTAAIADYLTISADKVSIDAIRARLTHVLTYLVATDQAALTCDTVDDDWIAKFRKWLAKVPIVSPSGQKRQRSLSTIENSVLQLAAAINSNGGCTAKFKATQPKEVNRTPQHRSEIAELASMFRYCVAPEPGKLPIERARRDRANLLAFLRISVSTLARPDAAHDVSTTASRRQWNSKMRVLALNPDGRRQTKKYRAIMPVSERMAVILDRAKGFLIPSNSVKSAWETMAVALKLQRHGESGMKLIRRSVAHIVRQRLKQEAWGELEIFLGHDKFDDVSDLYAPFQPGYLSRALAVIEEVIEEIEALCPGAFSA